MLFARPKRDASPAGTEPQIIPQGLLLRLKPEDIVPSHNNPRMLFDPEPLNELKKNIREHGVLVPITVYKPKGQSKYSILDGARRHRCCLELEEEGANIGDIPANVVDPPTKMAGLLYMFSIHNFREGWELMPTALSLKIIMDELGAQDTKALTKLTGLSEPQIERCKTLLMFPEEFQNLSLDPDPRTRIPSNFWIEALPILDVCEEELPALVQEFSRDGITRMLVEKYRKRAITSVIHFRRIMEAYQQAEASPEKKQVVEKLRQFITETNLETRKAFDEFVVDNRRIQSAISTCEGFVRQLERLKLDYTLERDELRKALEEVKDYTEQLLEKLKGSDPPPFDSVEV